MKRQPLEPGLLAIFRLYVFVRLAAMPALAALYYVRYEFALTPGLIPVVVAFAGDVVFLSVYLAVPWFRRKLGRVFLPVALFVAAVGPISQVRYSFALYGVIGVPDFWLLFPFLCIPLILTAWQYSFRQVLLFCLGTAALEMAFVGAAGRGNLVATVSTWGGIVSRSAILLLIGHIVTTLMAAQRQQRRELEDAHAKLLHYAATLEHLTLSRERNRLARELHDTLAHTLSGLAVQLEAIISLWQPIPERAQSMLQRALTITREGLEETRRALQDLRAAPLEDLGLPMALRTLAESVTERHALRLETAIAEEVGTLPPEVEQCYYRVAQEALQNAVTHAEARCITVSLARRGRELLLQVADNGRGFGPEAVAPGERLGLQGMRERAELIGGSLQVEGRAQGGTVVSLRCEVGV
jgi:signal transduction histidine kinase